MDCQKFLENPTINPATGRKIKEGGATYKKLMKMCKEEDLIVVAKKKAPTKKKKPVVIIEETFTPVSPIPPPSVCTKPSTTIFVPAPQIVPEPDVFSPFHPMMEYFAGYPRYIRVFTLENDMIDSLKYYFDSVEDDRVDIYIGRNTNVPDGYPEYYLLGEYEKTNPDYIATYIKVEDIVITHMFIPFIEELVEKVTRHFYRAETTVRKVYPFTHSDLFRKEFEKYDGSIIITDERDAEYFIGCVLRCPGEYINSYLSEYVYDNPKFEFLSMYVWCPESAPVSDNNYTVRLTPNLNIVDIRALKMEKYEMNIKAVVKTLYDHVKSTKANLPIVVNVVSEYEGFTKELEAYNKEYTYFGKPKKERVFIPSRANEDGSYYVAYITNEMDEQNYMVYGSLIEMFVTPNKKFKFMSTYTPFDTIAKEYDVIEYVKECVVYHDSETKVETISCSPKQQADVKPKEIPYNFRTWHNTFGKGWGKYENLRLTDVGVYSVAKPYVREVLRDIITKLPFKQSVIETNGGLGGFTIELCNVFREVTSYEIDALHAEILKNNVRRRNLTVIHDKYDISAVADVIISDPPWGKNYNPNVPMSLTLNGDDISVTVNMVFERKRCKVFILYVPSNFKDRDFYADIPSYLSKKVVPVSSKQYFIILERS